MTRKSFHFFVAAGLCCLMSATAFAQSSNWVDFVDQRERLQFDTDDDQEKDMIVGDLDNDGDEDIVVVRKRPFSVDGPRVNLLLMNENGNLVDRTSDFTPTFLSNPDNARDIQLLDSDNDGWLDMVVANTFGSLHRLYINRGEDGSGNWLGFEDQGDNGEWYSPQFTTTPQSCGLATGDVNGDGFDDIWFADYNNGLEAHLFINNGDNTFTDETDSRMSAAASNQAFGTTGFLADMNGDGALDIVSNDSVAFGGIGVEVAYNNGSGGFFQTQVLPSVASYMVAPVDVNTDGRMDIYVVDDFQDYVLINNSTNGNGTINASMVNNSQASLTQNFNGNILAADMDNDGFMDMVVSDVDVDIPGCGRNFCLLRNNGSGMTDPNNNNLQDWNVEGSHDTVVIDINNDGNLDLFVATCDDYHMFVNTADPAFVLGDINNDGVVNLLDVAGFVDLLSGAGDFDPAADINGDDAVNLLDVDGFILLLGGA